MSSEQGLRTKYHITKADGSPLPDDAKLFVLRYDKDPAAQMALRAYARATDNIALRLDLFNELDDVPKYSDKEYEEACGRLGISPSEEVDRLKRACQQLEMDCAEEGALRLGYEGRLAALQKVYQASAAHLVATGPCDNFGEEREEDEHHCGQECTYCDLNAITSSVKGLNY